MTQKINYKKLYSFI